jgi:hypothetical protein
MKNDKRLLIDTYSFQATTLEESKSVSGQYIARGEFARSDRATENKRLYPKHLWEREVGRLSKSMQVGKIFGECDHPCLTEPFEVFTVNGWKQFHEVKLGDKVWSRVDGQAVASTVEAITDVPYNGPVYRIAGKALNAAFTPNHKMLFEYRPDESKVPEEKYASMSELVQGRVAYGHSGIPKTASWHHEKLQYFVVPAVKDATGKTKNDVSEDLHLDPKLFAAFMGLYLSEGSKANGGNNYTISIRQKNAWSKKHMFDEVLSLFPAHLSWRETEDGFELCDQRLHQYVEKLGDCYSKYIPDEVKKLDSDCLKELLYWLTIGDGRIAANSGDDLVATNSRREVFSVSKKLISDLHECLVKSGGSGSLSTAEAKNEVLLHSLKFSTAKHIWLDSKLQINEEHHEGNVYCFTTTHGSFFMRHGGQSFWTGNSDGRTSLKRVSHLITDLRLEGDVIIGTATILDTQEGRNLKAIFDGGGSVGVSSRGFGTTKPGSNGEEVVQDDYNLMTFDFVSDPAQKSAYPVITVGGETLQHTEESMIENMTLEEFKTSHPQLAESFLDDAEREYEKRGAEIWAQKIMASKQEASTNLRAEFAEKLESTVAEAKKEMERTVTERLMQDPTVAGAKKAMAELSALLRPYVIPANVESVVKEKEDEIAKLEGSILKKNLEISNLMAENDKLSKIAKEAGYKYHLEQRLNDIGHAEEIRAHIGDVKNFKSLAEMDNQIVSIAESIVRRDAAVAEQDSVVASLQREVATQKLIAEKALEASKYLASQVYLEQRLANHPHKGLVRSLSESVNIRTNEEVDSLVSRTLPTMSEDIEAARARVRQLTGSGTREYLEEQVEDGSRSSNHVGAARDYNGLGANLNEIRALSGLPE